MKLPLEDLKLLRRNASLSGRSVSNLICSLVTRYLDTPESHVQVLRDHLRPDDVDALRKVASDIEHHLPDGTPTQILFSELSAEL